MNRRWIGFTAAAFLVAGIAAAIAQTTLAPAYVKWGDGSTPSTPPPAHLVVNPGGVPCIVGSSDTCTLPVAFAQPIANDPAVQNAAYTTGQCIGGFQQVTVAINNGQSGFIGSIRLASIGGTITSIVPYVFDASPAASTCTDRGTFTLAAADVDKLLNTPAAVAMAAPSGTSVSFGEVDFSPPAVFLAGGSTASGIKTIYVAFVAGANFTPATTTDLHSRLAIILN